MNGAAARRAAVEDLALLGQLVELARLDRRLAGQTFIAGDHYSIADITGLVAIDFMKPAGVAKPENYANIARWYEAVSARPSAAA